MMIRRPWFGALSLAALTLLVPLIAAADKHVLQTLDNKGKTQSLQAIIPALSKRRVVYIGESHDRYDHHLNQLEVIRQLHEQAPKWAIGVEFFQQPFQPYLDAYIAGSIDESEFLAQTEYFQRWRYDYRLYRPIFQYAKEQGIALVALNAAEELVAAVSEKGLDALSVEQRQQIPAEIDMSDNVYRQRLEDIFAQHPQAEKADFERFWQVQLLWDESMAERAAQYLQANPDKSLIVLAGQGHIAYGHGIPQRVQRRLAVTSSLLLPGEADESDHQGADYWLLSEQVELSAPGRMGVGLDLAEGVSAASVQDESGAAKAGMQVADRILAIDERSIQSLSDLRIALLDKTPGEEVAVKVQRQGEEGTADLILVVTLQ